MKNLTIFLAFALMFSTSFAQKKSKVETFEKPKFTIDETTKMITYQNVVETTGTKNELYNKGLSWYKSYYKNPTNVIREQDKTNHKIVGKGRFKILNPKDKKGMQTMAGIVQYTITTFYKDGKIKYVINDINWKQTSKYPAEKWLDESSPSYRPKYNYFLQQVDEYMKKTTANLESKIKAQAANTNNDNW